MTRRSLTRRFAPLALGLSLALTSGNPDARAQPPDAAPPGGEEKDSGRPVDGYIATTVLAAAVLFAVGKSARR